MSRVLSIGAVLGLLAATAVAFAVTERAKLTLSPIAGTFVTKQFSPNAVQASYRTASIRFRLRKREKVTVWIEDNRGKRIDTLLSPRTLRSGSKVDLVWDGFAANGVIVPDGVYRPVVKLETSHLTTTLHPILSPDGDGHGDLFRVRYRMNGRAHGLLYVRTGARADVVEFTRSQKPTGDLQWNGKLNGKALKPGRYVLLAGAQDDAGNRSQPTPFAVATIRYISLGQSRLTVAPGKTFALLTSTDAPTVDWRFKGASGTEKSGTLHFNAPRKAGTYTLYVSVGSHAARCTVVVR